SQQASRSTGLENAAATEYDPAPIEGRSPKVRVRFAVEDDRTYLTAEQLARSLSAGNSLRSALPTGFDSAADAVVLSGTLTDSGKRLVEEILSLGGVTPL